MHDGPGESTRLHYVGLATSGPSGDGRDRRHERGSLDLRSGTDNNLVDVDIGRLLDGKRDRSGDRLW